MNKSDDGALAVLGVLMNAGQENAALAELFDKIPTTKTDEQSAVELDEKIDPTDLIPAESKVARYSGSLTTPPCSEPVIWSVFLTPSAVSDPQLAALAAIFPGNHRPTQPLNGRLSEVSSTVNNLTSPRPAPTVRTVDRIARLRSPPTAAASVRAKLRVAGTPIRMPAADARRSAADRAGTSPR